ncbi:hypothetical protein XA68_17504 [Ophiocordyceps unilateralis]|uniref:C2H2-type domain-containing protein n=1 Tax=Ophiocordyceps unilateralis TaxID=268505 RepID=A0A2A9PKF9_OPHUN|nr:hypothetical protein XA68_17504 [Ophiocordyceps unilateralis]
MPSGLQSNGSFLCKPCNLVFPSWESLHEHKQEMRTAGHASHIHCKHCSQDFKTGAAEQQHIQLFHPQGQNLICRKCGLGPFARVSGFIEHIEVGRCTGLSAEAIEEQRVKKAEFARGLQELSGMPARNDFSRYMSSRTTSRVGERDRFGSLVEATGGGASSDGGVVLSGHGDAVSSGPEASCVRGPVVASSVPDDITTSSRDEIAASSRERAMASSSRRNTTSSMSREAVIKSAMQYGSKGVTDWTIRGMSTSRSRVVGLARDDAASQTSERIASPGQGDTISQISEASTLQNRLAGQGNTTTNPHTSAVSSRAASPGPVKDSKQRGFVLSPGLDGITDWHATSRPKVESRLIFPWLAPGARCDTDASQASASEKLGSTATEDVVSGLEEIEEQPLILLTQQPAMGAKQEQPVMTGLDAKQQQQLVPRLIPALGPVREEPKKESAVSALKELSQLQETTTKVDMFESMDPDHPDHPSFNSRRYYSTYGETYVCPKLSCGKTFHKAGGLVAHLRSLAHAEKKYHCPYCHRRFPTLTAIVAHAEQSSSRCHIRESDNYDAFMDQLTGGVIDVGEERHDDGTIKYEMAAVEW